MSYEVIPNGLTTKASIRGIKIMWSKNGKQLFAQAAFNIDHADYLRRCVWHKFFLHGAPEETLQISSDPWYDMLEQIGGSQQIPPDLKVPAKGSVAFYNALNKKEVAIKKGSNGFRDTNEIAAIL
ncbi:hypothetical protein IOQ59_09240 [Pontibacterium sp. N1Y112]|uniref:Uncharacterized protein n=1 Tax=Pontibacterium sinense TaxID=2781979 RepID=A0A8J7FDJ5_9GAMM|nr:hypothetical protein [Pontibacterium sinense]MBE9397444.1 hypothetical protein [Pontibacterium sinense]